MSPKILSGVGKIILFKDENGWHPCRQLWIRFLTSRHSNLNPIFAGPKRVGLLVAFQFLYVFTIRIPPYVPLYFSPSPHWTVLSYKASIRGCSHMMSATKWGGGESANFKYFWQGGGGGLGSFWFSLTLSGEGVRHFLNLMTESE